MRKLLILLVFGLVFSSCEESLSERETRLEEERNIKKETIKQEVVSDDEIIIGSGLTISPVEQIIEEVEKIVHVTYKTVSTDSSYWFVIAKDDKTTWHGTVSLPIPYFDFVEAEKGYKKKEGKLWFKYIFQITKEGRDSYEKLTKGY